MGNAFLDRVQAQRQQEQMAADDLRERHVRGPKVTRPRRIRRALRGLICTVEGCGANQHTDTRCLHHYRKGMR